MDTEDENDGYDRRSSHPDRRPDPDPTRLTTAALMREILALRELLEAKMVAAALLTEQRFDALALAVQALDVANRAAASKAEAATSKQLDAVSDRVAANGQSVNEKIASISARIDRGDGVDRGREKSTALMFAVAAIIISAVGSAIAMMALFARIAG